ncbi:MAG: acyltransferase [Bacteroidales bacterium]|jgi:hypothetical protein|nr:acyltransferase [Bacteroidales bacterium]
MLKQFDYFCAMGNTDIFNNLSEDAFNEQALSMYFFQRENNPVYRQFIHALNRASFNPMHYSEIPFLPVEFFKTHRVASGDFKEEEVFSSSGTTGSIVSQHFVRDVEVYHQSYREAFRWFYGDVYEWVILALLPSYLEREGSSLVMMAEGLIKDSKNKLSGFFLNDIPALLRNLKMAQQQKDKKILLLGVSFALFELAEKHHPNLKGVTVMETGGMKGRRQELIREELHRILCEGFGVSEIHSEYGMTELLSQAYSSGKGIYRCPPWLKVVITETEDPFSMAPKGKSGLINLIDLANIHSCGFIATRDLGRQHADGSFEVLGRFDHSDVRGCNLMVG